jgi:hypothetical protein
MSRARKQAPGHDIKRPMMHRRQALRLFAGFALSSPLWANEDDVLGPINVHEFEEVAKRKLHKLAYDFIAGGVEDELTLRANREAYTRWYLVPRVMLVPRSPGDGGR